MENVAKSSMNQRNAVSPPPPPLPPPTLSGQQKKIMAEAMAKERRGSSVSTATRDLWEHLFDQGYRADVVIHTDHGGQIYAHACVLV